MTHEELWASRVAWAQKYHADHGFKIGQRVVIHDDYDEHRAPFTVTILNVVRAPSSSGILLYTSAGAGPFCASWVKSVLKVKRARRVTK